MTCILTLAGLIASGCAADYDERIEYLHKVALRGVEVHILLQNQGDKVNEDNCKTANKALNDDAPDTTGGPDPKVSEEWKQLVEQTFLTACVSGKY
ncbi:hypothetical protein [Amycolatopsis nalaikhensis]|uniref:Lipoprotein n=1 Tax=Amycolatopsis nalaikhensis TaxID=715472 RepID=A0ABY8X853_9PSEU|nr:hypothetical protein [Amycolatopsis sp. 2-2]WIV52582.1 hypothetical protein QP939_26845 [Amycolatopsis sp. 2-2]